MLIIEIIKLELIGGHIEIMLIIEIPKIEFSGGHFGIMLFLEVAILENFLATIMKICYL